MSDDEENADDVKSFGLDDSGSDFAFGCHGVTGDKYPMEELDEWDAEEVCTSCNGTDCLIEVWVSKTSEEPVTCVIAIQLRLHFFHLYILQVYSLYITV